MTDGDLEAVLIHARALVDGADQLDWVRSDRAAAATQALLRWQGPHADTFEARISEEDDLLQRRAQDLRREADEWAGVWAETVNRINAERHQAAVDEVRSRRGFGEQFFDMFVGDDSDQFVPPYHRVSVPSAATGFQATGGLENYG
jgi:hypothetical protein